MNPPLNLLDADHRTADASPTPVLRTEGDASNGLHVLGRDQRRIMCLIERYRSGADNVNNPCTCDEVCARLSVHILIEEALLFPLLGNAPGKAEALAEAEIGHYVIKQLIRQLQNEELRSHRRTAVFGVLADYVEQHFDEEREVLFRMLADSRVDLKSLAAAILSAKRLVEPRFSIAHEHPGPVSTGR